MEGKLIQQFIDYLDCYCEVLAPMQDDDEIKETYLQKLEEGRKEGFCPILVTVDETLWECLLMNSDPESELSEEALRHDIIDAYRKKMLEFTLPDGGQCVDGMISERKEEAEEDGFDWEKEVMGEFAGGEPLHQFLSYWNYETRLTEAVILACIPVENPWEIYAYLPFGGWNECPDTLELMAVSKYWYETYGAVPAALSHDQLEFYTQEAVKREAAKDLALEQYAFCPDRVDQCGEDCSIGELADCLSKSTIWYFWWD